MDRLTRMKRKRNGDQRPGDKPPHGETLARESRAAPRDLTGSAVGHPSKHLELARREGLEAAPGAAARERMAASAGSTSPRGSNVTSAEWRSCETRPAAPGARGRAQVLDP